MHLGTIQLCVQSIYKQGDTLYLKLCSLFHHAIHHGCCCLSSLVFFWPNKKNMLNYDFCHCFSWVWWKLTLQQKMHPLTTYRLTSHTYLHTFTTQRADSRFHLKIIDQAKLLQNPFRYYIRFDALEEIKFQSSYSLIHLLKVSTPSSSKNVLLFFALSALQYQTWCPEMNFA